MQETVAVGETWIRRSGMKPSVVTVVARTKRGESWEIMVQHKRMRHRTVYQQRDFVRMFRREGQ